MTEKTQPTDAELEKLFVEETGFDIDDFPAAILDFARAVLQRWGPPSGAGNHPHAIQWDAELGRTAMRFVDRAGDVHPGIDDAETICADFHKAMSAVIERMPHVQRMSAPQPSPTAQAAPAAGAVAGSEWKLVPVEPTDDMLRAIRNQRSGGRVGAGDRADWAAWLAAAPTPPAQAADSVLEDAERYRCLKSQSKEQLLNPRGAASEFCADMRTHWKLPVLMCSGPIGGYLSFDDSVDILRAAQEDKSHG